MNTKPTAREVRELKHDLRFAHRAAQCFMDSIDEAKERRASLFEAIAHGDDKHRAWLKAAIDAHFAGKPIPKKSR